MHDLEDEWTRFEPLGYDDAYSSHGNFDGRRAAKTLPLIDLSQWAEREPPVREWALKDWIPARQATYLTGPGSSGKSLLTQQLCTAIACGLPLLGIEAQQAKALYLTCEDDADELERRQKAICEALNIDRSALAGNLHIVSLAGAIGNELATFNADGKMTVSARFSELIVTATSTGSMFIGLDNVAHLFSGNENIRNQVAAFCGLLNRLAAETGAAVLFLGHPNKAGNDFSGSTAWENQVRSRLFLDVPKDETGSIVDRDERILSRGKANYARNGETVTFRWHKWAFVRAEELPADYAKEMSATILATRDNDIFLKCLDERNRQRRAVSEKSGANFAPAIFSKMPEAKGVSKDRLGQAMDRLFRLGQIERGPLWRDTNKGRDIEGLKRRETNPQTPPPSDPQTHFPSDPERAVINPQTHTLLSKDNIGPDPEVSRPELGEVK